MNLFKIEFEHNPSGVEFVIVAADDEKEAKELVFLDLEKKYENHDAVLISIEPISTLEKGVIRKGYYCC